MRIENLTADEAKKLNNEELRYLRSRFINIYSRYFEGSDIQKAVDIDRRVFLNKYLILRSEVQRRGITLFRHASIDKEVVNRIFKKAMWKLDVQSLEDIIAVPAYVSVSGDFIKSPVSAKKIEVVLMSKEENRSESFEKRIGALIKKQTGKEPFFTYRTEGPDSSYIPVFDLMLKARDETKKVRVVKEKDSPIKIDKLSATQQVEYDAETARIKENEKLPIASKPHEFKAAKYTHPNGHPRCLICGDEESIGKVCNMPKAWYQKHDWEDEKAWAEERKKLKASGKIKKSFPIKKPEETENTIRIPIGPDCEVTATITIDEGQGISALYCGKIKKIRTYLFDKKKKAWTMTTARAWIKEHEEKTEKALGEGQGVGGERQGIGGAEICVCPECGHEQKHERGVACAEIECPECGTAMKGKVGKAEFRIVKVDKAQQIVGGVVYEPYEVDTQGDFTDEKEIEKAMTLFMKKYATDSKRIKINHLGKRYFFPILESFIPDEDTIKGGQPLKKGSWWLQIHVTNKAIWEDVLENRLTGFSMGGTGKG